MLYRRHKMLAATSGRRNIRYRRFKIGSACKRACAARRCSDFRTDTQGVRVEFVKSFVVTGKDLPAANFMLSVMGLPLNLNVPSLGNANGRA